MRLHAAMRIAAAKLAVAGVPTPRVDAEVLAAHVLGVERWRLALSADLDAAQTARFEELVNERVRRVPLQHLTGVAHFRRLELAVGPGVFVPRPETEVLVDWALRKLSASPVSLPVVVDVCAGSGAIALSIVHEWRSSTVHAVEASDHAIAWLRRNAEHQQQLGDPAITVHHADAFAAATLAELDGTVDLVISNPPYIPAGSTVEPEAGDHDPELALWSGADGLDAVRMLIPRAAALLRPDGWLGFEHGEQHTSAVANLLRAQGWREISSMPDLTRRPRFTTAQRPA